jgi:crotonobetainyl-CoA:carnitine CoA-transferase CaiB-like acyl-CoA transferase
MRFSGAEPAADRPPPELDAHGAAIREALGGGADWPAA